MTTTLPEKQPHLAPLSTCIILPPPKQSFSLKSSSETTALLTVSSIAYLFQTWELTSKILIVVHPMQFITGQGKHSVDGKAVLRPAVYDALVKDGWDVSTFAGGLAVRGRLRS
jgi:hypothetical protein